MFRTYFLIIALVNTAIIISVILDFKDVPGIPDKNYTSLFDPFVIQDLIT